MFTKFDIEFECEDTTIYVFVIYNGELTIDILNKVFDEVLDAFDNTLSLDYYIGFLKTKYGDPCAEYTFINLAKQLGRTDDIRKRVDEALQ